MQSIHIRVSDELNEALREEAYGSRRSKNQIIVDAIHEFRRNAFVPRPAKEETAMTEEYVYADLCGCPNPVEGDGVHVAGEPSDLICLKSPAKD